MGFNEERVNEVYNMKGFQTYVDGLVKNIATSESILTSLTILLQTCELDSNLIIDIDRAPVFLEGVNSLSITQKAENIAFINLMFSFVSLLGKDKNPAAPTLYKIIVNKYQQCSDADEANLYAQNLV